MVSTLPEDLSPYVRMAGTRQFSTWQQWTRVLYDWELLLVVRGRCHYVIEDRTYALEQGDSLLFRPYTIHAGEMDSTDVLELTWVHFDPTFIRDRATVQSETVYGQETRDEPYRGLHLGELPEFVHLTDTSPYLLWQRTIEKELTDRNPGYELACRAALLQMIILLHRVDQQNTWARQDDHPEVWKTREYLHAHYTEPIGLDQLAQRCHWSPEYLSRQFHRLIGYAPIEYLRRIRLEKAKELLASGNWLVGEVADLVGIPDAHYFSRVFRRYEGVTPSQYIEIRSGI